MFEQTQCVDGGAALEYLLGDAAGVELLEGARVYAEGPGEIGSVGAPLDQRGRDARASEIAREQQPGGSAADDQDIGLFGNHHALQALLSANGCWPTLVGKTMPARL